MEEETISIREATHPRVQRFSAEALLGGLSIVGGGNKWKRFVISFFLSSQFLSRQTRKGGRRACCEKSLRHGNTSSEHVHTAGRDKNKNMTTGC